MPQEWPKNENQEKIKTLTQLFSDLQDVNNNWKKLSEFGGFMASSADLPTGVMPEWEVRDLEKKAVQELLAIDFNKTHLTSEQIEIINEYLAYGDCSDLMSELAKKADIEYRDPFDLNPTHGSLAAEQILDEIGEHDNKTKH